MEADHAQGQFHSTRIPADSLWSASYKTEWIALGWSIAHIKQYYLTRWWGIMNTPSCWASLLTLSEVEVGGSDTEDRVWRFDGDSSSTLQESEMREWISLTFTYKENPRGKENVYRKHSPKRKKCNTSVLVATCSCLAGEAVAGGEWGSQTKVVGIQILSRQL